MALSMHVLLRMSLAIIGSDASVERLFSRLTHLLTPLRLQMTAAHVEQALIVAHDAGELGEHDLAPALHLYWDGPQASGSKLLAAPSPKGNCRRTPFRQARKDKKNTAKRPRKAQVQHPERESSSSSASQTSSEGESSDSVLSTDSDTE